MTITLHHLGISQSERIVWLLEELSLPFTLIKHTRAPILSPDSLKSVPGNSTGKAPFLVDDATGVTLSESGAICEYILGMYGEGKLSVQPGQEADQGRKYAEYLYWFHFANGTLQPAMSIGMFIAGAGISPDNPMAQFARQRMDNVWRLLDARLEHNKYLAGADHFTAADVMTLYCVTTQRYWGPRDDLATYPNLLRWLRDCTGREAYKRAMEKGDPDMKVLNGPEAPDVAMMEAGGVESKHWRK